MASTLRLERITKRFGDFVAVDDVTVDIAPGEFTTLVGPSGCGKTTLLNIAAALERPSTGSIVIDGRDMTEFNARERGIAMVFQSYALYPHLTVRQNLGFPLRVQKVPKAEIARRVNEAADLMEIGHLLNRKPRELSGGQRQRVAIGRAVIRPSTVCLLDEPLSNLDAALRVRVRAELKLLFARMGTTTMFVTHDQSEAMTMSDRVVVLKDGKVQQQGAPLEVYRNPANVFVASFIGSPQMNLLPGQLASDDGRPAVKAGALDLGLSAGLAAAAGARSEIILGIRAEDIATTPFANSSKFSARIELVEHLGNSAIMHYRTADGGRILGMEMRDSGVGTGWSGDVHVNLDAVKLFDSKTTAAL
ncbi:MAG: ABC transporter ATP-binding protein [Devosia nanyangense]|uniref:ABC transporter ATP-binding protein n=1 Tax=Devosia nanyangense TaxID=1228055 RepID=A0A933L598_9HYPH|nr:ABC transporter ATP-binding protein [Devosia nanyangense]